MAWLTNYVTQTGDSQSALDFVAAGDWELLSVYVHLTSTATGGNRLMTLEIYDDSDATTLIDQVRCGKVQVASTDWHYHFAKGHARLTGAYDTDQITAPMPSWVLRKGQMLRVLDGSSIANDSDNIVVHITGWLRQSLYGAS